MNQGPLENIPVFKPMIGDNEISAAAESLRLGWLGMGSYVGEFEKSIEKLMESDDKFVVALSTGHAALHLGLILAGVGPGDEVITPSFNNVSDFQAILAVGASPVFCDIDSHTLCIDLESAEELVNEKTKAIIVMDYGFELCDHDAVKRFSNTHNIRVLHDAAHSFGSRYKGKMVGSFSDLTMFSFDPVKTITSIDGGVLVVNSEEDVAKLHEMRLVGMSQAAKMMYKNQRAFSYDVAVPGYRYHMANLHAAIGLSQLSQLGVISKTRRDACNYYYKQLKDIPEIQIPNPGMNDIVPFLYCIQVPLGKRTQFREHLLSQGIDTGIHWQPGHHFTLFKDCKCTDLSKTELISEKIVTLPLHSNMSESDLDHITSSIKIFFSQQKY